MFVSPAYAQAAGGGGGFGDLGPLLPLILIFVVFYFLLIRPQQKKQKAHRELIANLRRGDRIVTAGGVIGQVTRVVDERELMVEIAEGVRVRVLRGMVTEVLSKVEPARARDDREEEDEKPTAAEKAEDSPDVKKEAKS
jgi:preprotein translocase subunit YajC